MSSTRLSDIIVPQVFADYSAIDAMEKTALFQSGAVITSPLLKSKVSEGGDRVNLPFWRDLDPDDTANISDTTSNKATPTKAKADVQVARKAFLNKGWGAMDLSSELAGDNIPDQIKRRLDVYWTRQFQRRLVASISGVVADNIANDGGDLVHSIADDTTATPDTKMNESAVIEALAKKGDAFEDITTIILHSKPYFELVRLRLIETKIDPVTSQPFETYLGKRIVVDDGLPAVSAGSGKPFAYTTVLAGAGAFGIAEGSPEIPLEIERQASSGNGGGEDILWSRRTLLLHPFGMKFTSGNVAGESPTLDELTKASNWTRVVGAKNVPLSFLVTH